MVYKLKILGRKVRKRFRMRGRIYQKRFPRKDKKRYYVSKWIKQLAGKVFTTCFSDLLFYGLMLKCGMLNTEILLKRVLQLS